MPPNRTSSRRLRLPQSLFYVTVATALLLLIGQLHTSARRQQSSRAKPATQLQNSSPQRHNDVFDLFTSHMRAPRRNATFLKQPRGRFYARNRTCAAGNSTAAAATVTMVTFIKSAAANLRRRELLRRTWTSVCSMNGWSLRAVYVIGRTWHAATNRLLEEEQRRYGDLLQYDGPDNYRNMPYKVLAGMQWADQRLPGRVLYASADDDFLVDLEALTGGFEKRLEAARSKNQSSENAQPTGLPPPRGYEWIEVTDERDVTAPMLCLFSGGALEPVGRDGKWRVDRDVYPHEWFPRYCHGGMYVMEVDTMRRILRESRHAPALHLDDVWITGVLRHRAGIADRLVLGWPHVAVHYGAAGGDVGATMEAEWTVLMDRMSSKPDNKICKCPL